LDYGIHKCIPRAFIIFDGMWSLLMAFWFALMASWLLLMASWFSLMAS
jgi:hypothetical protein